MRLCYPTCNPEPSAQDCQLLLAAKQSPTTPPRAGLLRFERSLDSLQPNISLAHRVERTWYYQRGFL